MTIDMKKAEQWFEENVGKHTYSMTYPRFDCSSSVANALKAAGANVPNPLSYSTTSLGRLLQENGFEKVYSGPTIGAKDFNGPAVILMSAYANMDGSGGSNGHTGVLTESGNFWNTTATDWNTGKMYLPGNAVQLAPWNKYAQVTRLKALTEIWKLKDNKVINNNTSKLDENGFWNTETTKALQKYLNKIKYNLVVDGIMGMASVSALQQALNAKLKISLVIDGIMGKLTISALQKVLGTPIDGVISKPSVMVKEMQKVLNGGKQWL